MAELVRRRRIQIENIFRAAHHVKPLCDEQRNDFDEGLQHFGAVGLGVLFAVVLQIEVQLARKALRHNLVRVPLVLRLPRVVVPKRLGMRDHEVPLAVALFVRERHAATRFGLRVVQRLLLPGKVFPTGRRTQQPLHVGQMARFASYLFPRGRRHHRLEGTAFRRAVENVGSHARHGLSYTYVQTIRACDFNVVVG